jgi:hypothetical protein
MPVKNSPISAKPLAKFMLILASLISGCIEPPDGLPDDYEKNQPKVFATLDEARRRRLKNEEELRSTKKPPAEPVSNQPE